VALFTIQNEFRYEIVRKIYEGGMGIVYEAEQLGTRAFVKRVAIKIIRQNYDHVGMVSAAPMSGDWFHAHFGVSKEPMRLLGWYGPNNHRAQQPGRRIEIDTESVERGLGALVLTVVELLRQLMERQALRRVDAGDLTDDQIERIGQVLMELDEQMTLLREHFGLEPSDLNLDLGRLGPLLPK